MDFGVLYAGPAGFLLFVTDDQGKRREQRYALHSIDGRTFQTYLIYQPQPNLTGGMTLELMTAEGEVLFTIHHDVASGLWCNGDYFERFANLIALKDVAIVPLPSTRESNYLCQYGDLFCLVSNDHLLPDKSKCRFFVGPPDDMQRQEVVGIKVIRQHFVAYGIVEFTTLTIEGNQQLYYPSYQYRGDRWRPEWNGRRMHWLALSRYDVTENDVRATARRIPVTSRR
jgi:hypothetical protein